MHDKIINTIKVLYIRLFKNIEVNNAQWVFSSSFNTKFNYNSKYLFEYVLENHPEITPLYIINDKDLRKQLQKRYGEKYFIESKSFDGIRKVLSSGVWLTSAGLPVYGFNLKKDRLIINLWHGVPLKKIGLKEQKLNVFTKIYFKKIFSENYTYILTTTEKLISIMAESFGVSEEKIKVWGQPRNDAIFNQNNKNEILDNLYSNLPFYEKIILYAPTYRENSNTVFFPFKDFSTEKLNDFLEKKKLLIFIRCHQSDAKNISQSYGDRVNFINDDKVEDIMDVLNIFDLLITDYSSIYIDYLLTKNPILFLPYDKDEYLSTRGMNFNYDTVTPGPKPTNFVDFKVEIYKLLNSKYYSYERRELNNYFNKYQHSVSKNIYNKILKIGDRK